MYYIYKITNPENGKAYIGRTKNPKKRWNNGKGYRFNEILFNDILNYGWENFGHEILEQTEDVITASELEVKYIKKFNTTNPQNGYNKSTVRDSREHKLNNKHSVPVFQYSIDGEYLAEYPSAAEAERQTGVNYAEISSCCHGKRKHAYGFQWSFEKHEKVSGTFVGKYPPNHHKEKVSTRKTKIQMFDSDGSLLGEYESAKDVERKTGISALFVRTSCAGNYKKPKKIYFKKVSINDAAGKGNDER